ncbi:hypothetical protein KK488_05620 [Sphingobium sp. H33]|uniref:Uncharacterized protein n=2 Tax=Sphingobium nicotianae TaxID=2782607 RepID=A0A9X1DAZ3_9SPHN|nr:hypothetical protein [Sphingobium nicotianae]
MLLAAMLLLQAPAEAEPPDSDFDEVQDITVIASKLRQISVAVTRNAQGKYQCDLSASTGLTKLDGELCKATTRCVRKGKDSEKDVKACVEKAKPTLIARIRDYLVAQRAGTGV